MDPIQHILIMVGDSPAPLNATVFMDETHPFETAAYHINLIRQANLADTFIARMSGKSIARAEIGRWHGRQRVPRRDPRRYHLDSCQTTRQCHLEHMRFIDYDNTLKRIAEAVSESQ